MAYSPLTSEGVAVNAAYTVAPTSLEVPRPPFVPGMQVIATDGSTWLFCQVGTTGSAIAAGDMVVISQDNAWTCVGATDATVKTFIGRPLGVAGAAAAVSTATTINYIWVLRAGYYATVNVVTSSTANALMRSSATTGRITTTANAGVSAQITGIVASSVAAANVAPCFLNFPAGSTAD